MRTIKTLFVIALFSVYNTSQAQEAMKKEMVKITNPSGRSVHLLNNYFTEDITKVILSQITKEKFTEIKFYCEEENYPECVKEALAYNPADTSSDAETKFLDQLKIYRIAKYDNIRNGENFGEESILVIPATENKNLNGNCNFEKDFYIIIYTKDLLII